MNDRWRNVSRAVSLGDPFDGFGRTSGGCVPLSNINAFVAFRQSAQYLMISNIKYTQKVIICCKLERLLDGKPRQQIGHLFRYTSPEYADATVLTKHALRKQDV